MKIGILGYGEVGRCFAQAVASLGNVSTVIFDPKVSKLGDDPATPPTAILKKQAGSDLGDCDFILSCVPGSAVPDAVDSIIRHGASGQVVFDLATASSQAKRAASQRCQNAGLHYIDVAIMGAISIHGAATPMLAAGDAQPAEVVAATNWLSANGFKLQWLNGREPGDAAALKLLRSVFTKGMEALAVECLMAAEHFGLRSQLYEALVDIDETPLSRFLDMLVSTHVVHAKRRLVEVDQAEALLRQAGLPTIVTPSVKALFAQTAAGNQAVSADSPPSPEVALAALRAISERQQQKRTEGWIT